MSQRKCAFLAFALSAFFGMQAAHAGCTLEEIVKMAKGGSGKTVISEQCDSEADDLPRCRFDRVVTLAISKRSTYSIRDECGLCDRPKCELGSGACWLGATAPRGIKPGDACHCFTQRGPIMGEVSCNN